MRSGRSILKDIFIGGPLLGTRMWLVLGSLAWSIFLIAPSTTDTCGSCQLMNNIAPNYVWSAAFLLHSLWAYYTLRTGVRNTLTLFMDAFLGATLWTSVTILAVFANFSAEAALRQALQWYIFPAGMASQVVMNLASLWHMVNYWAEEPSRERCKSAVGVGVQCPSNLLG